jgi:hypothetical protein
LAHEFISCVRYGEINGGEVDACYDFISTSQHLNAERMVYLRLTGKLTKRKKSQKVEEEEEEEEQEEDEYIHNGWDGHLSVEGYDLVRQKKAHNSCIAF